MIHAITVLLATILGIFGNAKPGAMPPPIADLVNATGSTGISGASGASGSTGTSGTTGTSGASGATGTSGATGESGASGASGTSGASGVSGASGASGSTGTSGTTGTSGISGASGAVGPSGATGATFPDTTKVPAINLSSGKTMPANIPVVAIENSPSLDYASGPTGAVVELRQNNGKGPKNK
ncbi:hypothetical protein HY410_00340 [Candidatus Gottesmanbacteria bacterium]|nr:hypothetical protein [Candidatus Gottesmanbacteria bacterium]